MTTQIYLGQKFIPLFRDDYRYAAYYGGRGSGKSHAIATVLVARTSKETKRIVCARQFQNSIRDSSKELLEIKIHELDLRDQFKIYDREIINTVTESRYTFIGLDRNPDSAKSLEGADICWVEEARTINERSLEILIPTIRKPGSQLIFSWNPEFRTDPVDYYFRAGDPPPNSLVVPVGIEDNPWFYQSPLAQEMIFMQRQNYVRYLHVWLGGYDDGYDSKIYTDVLVSKLEVPDHFVARFGMDFGFGQDPSFIVKVYINENLKQIYVQKEAFGRVPLRDLPAMMDSVIDSRDDLVKGDSSQPGTIEHLQSQGFNIVGAKKGPGSVKSGINFVSGYKLIIDPDCEGLRDEARLYSWQIDRVSKKRISVPVDSNNHGMDSLRYALESDMEREQEEQDDDSVMTLRYPRSKRRAHHYGLS